MKTKQLRIAHRIARNLKHTWGELPLEDVLTCTDAAQISELCYAQLEEGPYGWGITAPDVAVDYDEVINHISSTGRIRYHITSHGTVTLCICRPGIDDDPVLVAGISEINPGTYAIDYVQVMLPKRSIHQVAYEYALLDDDEYKYFSADDEELVVGLPPLTMVHRRHVKTLVDIISAFVPQIEIDKFFSPIFDVCRPDSITVINEDDSEDTKERLTSLCKYNQGVLCPDPKEGDVRGQRVFGNIPLHLAALAKSVTVPCEEAYRWRTFRVMSD